MSLAEQVRLTLGLLVAITVIVSVARRVHVPYPILLFIAGAVLGFVPHLPRITLQPDVIFLIFLPPLLYAEASQTSWREFRDNLRPIALLAMGLVLMTTFVVAAVGHYVLGMEWTTAFVLGAVLAPTDTVAPAAVLRRLHVPRRIEVILNAESLLNDATALVIYRAAIAAAAGAGAFSATHASLAFVGAIVGGVSVGLVVGWAATWLHRIEDEYTTDVTLSLLVPFAAYLPAEAIHASGVVAVVVAGFLVGRRTPLILSPAVRLRAHGFWIILVFLLNGLLFILIGFQLRPVILSLGALSWQLVVDGAIVSLAVILVRVAWVYPATYLPRLIIPAIRRRDPYPDWKQVTVVAWTGLRGGLSLAAALAIPTFVAAGHPFPHRDFILFLTFCVLLATLVVQGLLLSPLIKLLHIEPDVAPAREEAQARVSAAEAARAKLDALAAKYHAPPPLVERLRRQYERRIEYHSQPAASNGDEDVVAGDAAPPADPNAPPPPPRAARWTGYRPFQRELLHLERDAIIRLRDNGSISDSVLHRVQRELDLDELRLNLEEQ